MGFLNILWKKISYDRHLKYSEEHISKIQRLKLINLIKYSYQNSQFYRELLQDADIYFENIKDLKLEDLPQTNKKMIMDNFNQLVTNNEIDINSVTEFIEKNPDPNSLYKDKYYIIHTSGTTGEIGYYIYSKDNWELLKAVGASRLFDHFGLKRKKYCYVGAVDGHYAGVSFFLSPINKFEQHFYKDFLLVDVNYPLKNYFDKLNELQPDVISGYPSVIKMLLDYQQKGNLDIKPQTILCGGEPLTAQTASVIEEYWGQIPYNFYGTSESLLMGIGCGQKGMYLFDDLNIIEIKEDHILLTNLYNYTEPLIRYKIDDLTVKIDKENKKWPFTYVQPVSGREEDLLWLRNKNGETDFIHPIVFVELHIKGLKQFQVIRTDDKNIRFKAVKKENIEDSILKVRIEKRIDELLNKKKMSNVDLMVDMVKEINMDSNSSKFKLIKT